MTMVVGMFDSLVNAQRAVSELVGSGYSKDAISVLVRSASREPDDDGAVHAGGVLGGGPLGAKLRTSDGVPVEHAVSRTLASAGLRPAAASLFADAVCNGAILVAVHCAEAGVRDARDILDIYALPERAREARAGFR